MWCLLESRHYVIGRNLWKPTTRFTYPFKVNSQCILNTKAYKTLKHIPPINIWQIMKKIEKSAKWRIKQKSPHSKGPIDFHSAIVLGRRALIMCYPRKSRCTTEQVLCTILWKCREKSEITGLWRKKTIVTIQLRRKQQHLDRKE